MKITRDLPQFEGKKVLITVTGLHEADFYFAGDGQIRKIGEFKLLFPHYSDMEGFFESAGGGRIFKSGSILEVEKMEIRHRFLKEMDRILDEMVKRNKFDEIYIFSPIYLKNELKSLLPREDRKRVKQNFQGNFTHFHPFQLLLMIKQSQKLGFKVPIKKDTGKILNLPKKLLKKERKK